MNSVNVFLSDPETNRAILRKHPTEEPINHYRNSLQITDTNVDPQKWCKQFDRTLKRTNLDSLLLWPKMDCSLLWADSQYGRNGWNVIYSWQKLLDSYILVHQRHQIAVDHQTTMTFLPVSYLYCWLEMAEMQICLTRTAGQWGPRISQHMTKHKALFQYSILLFFYLSICIPSVLPLLQPFV